MRPLVNTNEPTNLLVVLRDTLVALAVEMGQFQNCREEFFGRSLFEDGYA
jgi:hypothetical protein